MNDFLNAIDIYCKDIDIVSVGCRGELCEHADGDTDHECESSFSRAQCDSCGSSLGGDRLPGVMSWKCGTDAFGDTVWSDIDVKLCIDCCMYHANGDIPDKWNG